MSGLSRRPSRHRLDTLLGRVIYMTEMTLEKALDLWNGEGAAPDTSRLPAHIQERVPQAAEHASVMAEIGNQVDASRVGAFIEAAAAYRRAYTTISEITKY